MIETMLASKIRLPDAFSSQMAQLLGEDFAHFQEIYSQPPTIGLRINTIKVAALEQITRGLEPVPWCPSGFIIPPPHSPQLPLGGGKEGELIKFISPANFGGIEGGLGKHPYHAAGLYYLQDPSAMAAAKILAPEPGERVLDLSAAPGGKSTHLTALMQNKGLLVANEIHPQRVWELAENLERWGAQNVVITNETPERLATHFGDFFDRVLVDAPCSGEGMFRKSEAARRDWSLGLVQSCALRQDSILEQAARLVRPCGRMVYSTCTFNPRENEAVVARFMDRHPEFELLEIPTCPGYASGRPDWLPVGMERPELNRTVRLWPHQSSGEGHFIALLQKVDGSDFLADKVRQKVKKMDFTSLRTFAEFCQASLNIRFDPERLLQMGSYLYQMPEGLPDLSGLQVIHPGWWLGTLKAGRTSRETKGEIASQKSLAMTKGERFVPSHALALGLPAQAALRTLALPVDGEEVGTYLRGETLSYPGEDCWLLVTVDGYPLGWGRRTGGVIKNHYPRGLRRYLSK
jgi:NOL1/NOP2/sun family putative RNA methylase